MIRTLIQPNIADFPACFHNLLENCHIYDSSCSDAAKVFFLDKDSGLFLKSAAKGTLAKEAALDRYFHAKGLGAEVLAYETLEQDWLLTRQIPGEDCTHEMYRADPKRLCDITAERLRMLHDTGYENCPVSDRTAQYLDNARKNYAAGTYDTELFPDNWGYATAEEAWRVVEDGGKYLQTSTLLHGDYCLPNILLDNWKFSGFIDLDAGGVGDRHVDLFWGIWSLQFNLKTDAYRERFLDVYGRQDVNEELFRLIAAIEVFS